MEDPEWACKIDENPAGIKACRCDSSSCWLVLVTMGRQLQAPAGCADACSMGSMDSLCSLCCHWRALADLLGKGSDMPLRHNQHAPWSSRGPWHVR